MSKKIKTTATVNTATATANSALHDLVTSFHQSTDEYNRYEIETATNATKVNRTIDYTALYTALIKCNTKKQLVDTMNSFGLRTTTLPTTTPNKNDLYIQFIDKSRVLFGVRTLKLYTNDETTKCFGDWYFDGVNDGSYRTHRATVPNNIDNFKLILQYFLKNSDNWLVTEK